MHSLQIVTVNNSSFCSITSAWCSNMGWWHGAKQDILVCPDKSHIWIKWRTKIKVVTIKPSFS